MKDIAKRVFDVEIESLQYVAQLIDDGFVNVIETILEGKGKLIITGIGKSGLIGKKISAHAFKHRYAKLFSAPGRGLSR